MPGPYSFTAEIIHMKKWLLILLIPAFISCRQGRQQVINYYPGTQNVHEKYWVKTDSHEVKDGVYRLYGQNGKLLELRNCRSDLLCDTLMKYIVTGKQIGRAHV